LIHANTRREKYEGPKTNWDWPGLSTGPYPRKKQGLGSFDATVILGESPYVSPFALYQQIKGFVPGPDTKFADLAEMGTLFEPVMAELYRRRTNRQLIDRAKYKTSGRWDVRRHAELEWMVAAPDLEIEDPTVTGGLALAVDMDVDFEVKGNGLLEMKSKDSWGEFFDEKGNPPMEVLIQVQHQLAVCDLTWASIAVLMGRRFYWVDRGKGVLGAAVQQ
jgi:predicted phage-related endonuclease